MTFKKAVVFFACEASCDGRHFGPELLQRQWEAVRWLKENTDAHILLALSAAGFLPPERYSELIVSEFLSDGIAAERIQTFGDSESTASEIDAAEAMLCKQPPAYDEVYAASSDYHVARIVELWQIRHGRTVKPLPLHMPRSWYIKKRMLLEYPKRWLLHAPAWVQDRLGHVMRRLNMI